MILVLGVLLGVVLGILGTLAVQSAFGTRRIVVSNVDVPGAVKVDNPDSIAVKTITVPK